MNRIRITLFIIVVQGIVALAVVLGSLAPQITTHPAPTMSLPLQSASQLTTTNPAYFQVKFENFTDTFTIMLTDTIKIQQAEQIVSGVVTDTIRVMGKVIKEPASYNFGWSYHLEPASITFFEFAAEVCDASPGYVQEHLAEACGAFLPNCQWCSWGSHVAAEATINHTYLPLVSR